ncbi:MAG: hypothetical protein HKN03_03435 [Acidimicrobiales bacterium]|nr:hypothetical protein [Acidimicrobiales bacterium]
MARRKNNRGRTTPKGGPDHFRPVNEPLAFGTANAPPSFPGGPGDGLEGFTMDDLNDPGMELFTSMLAENGLSLADFDETKQPDDWEAATSSEDLMAIFVDRLESELAAGPAEFMHEASSFAWMIHTAEEEGERAAVVDVAAEMGVSGVSLASVLTVLGMTEEVRRAAHGRASRGRSELAPWLGTIEQASIGRVAEVVGPNDDDFEVLFEVLLPDVAPFHVLARVDRLRGETITDASSGRESFDEMIAEETGEVSLDHEGEYRIELIDHSRAADLLAHSLQWSIDLAEAAARQAEASEGETGETGAMGLPLVRWIAAMLPSSDVPPFVGLSNVRLDANLAAFEDYLGRSLNDRELDSLDGILLLTGESNPVRWTPLRILELIGNYASAFVHFETVVPLLKEYLPFAAQQNGDSEALLHENFVVIGTIEEKLPDIRAELEQMKKAN